MYRASQHLDQAGRYGIAVDGLATRSELRAYGAMLRGLHADDDRMRSLSRLPDGSEISSEAREALGESTADEGILAALLPVVWLIVIAGIVIVLIATFVTALTHPAGVHGLAVGCSIAVLAVIALAAYLTAAWAATERSWRTAAVWGVIGTVAVVGGVLLCLR